MVLTCSRRKTQYVVVVEDEDAGNFKGMKLVHAPLRHCPKEEITPAGRI